MSIDLNQDWIQDVRMPVAGDSFTWAGLEPTAAKKSIVIHHSGTNTANAHEDAFSIANYHVSHNGWGGIGYHLVVLPDGTIQYAGDLGTWRAHVLNQNPGRVGICLVGNFEEELPKEAQLKAARMLINFFLAPNNILPSLNYPSQVSYHNAIPGQSTGCPGWQGAHFAEWMGYLQGGEFPSALYAPVQAPVPEPEAPHVPTYQSSWLQYPQVETLTTGDTEGYAVDMTGNGNPTAIPANTPIQVAGEFVDDNGKKYYRTQYGVETGWPKQGQWYGVPTELFPSGGQPAVVAIPVVVSPTPEPGTVVEPQGSILADPPGAVMTDVTPPVAPTLVVAALPLSKFFAWVLDKLLRLLKIEKGS